MLDENPYHLAAKMLLSLRQRKEPRAVWIVGNTVAHTPDRDWDVDQMLAKGAVLVGVFDGDIPSVDLAESIIAADEDA